MLFMMQLHLKYIALFIVQKNTEVQNRNMILFVIVPGSIWP